MNIEVIEFYPMGRDEEREVLTGTMRVKLPDLGIHILGVCIEEKGLLDIFFARVEIRSGIFSLCLKIETNKMLIVVIREKGRTFIEKRLADTEYPLVVPEKYENEQKRAKPSKANNKVARAKETAPNLKSKEKIPEKRRGFVHG